MYTIFETGGKQFKVQEGDIIFVEKLEANEGEVIFDKVITISKEEDMLVGTPYVIGATVKGTLLKNGRGKKITVFNYKPKKGQKRKMGHRQPYSQVKIESINT
ncbi:MAG: 50S ribosomal protein L21 [Eubacterium sp.]|jgi:large subunit ribosomal protein L21|nr:50S ribosomal protein L21 [Eubacterium sp.]